MVQSEIFKLWQLYNSLQAHSPNVGLLESANMRHMRKTRVSQACVIHTNYFHCRKFLLVQIFCAERWAMEMVFLSGEKRNNIFLLFDEIKFDAIKDKWERRRSVVVQWSAFSPSTLIIRVRTLLKSNNFPYDIALKELK